MAPITSVRVGFFCLAFFVASPSCLAALAEPDTIVLLPPSSTGPKDECGVRAEYNINGSILRVELSGARANDKIRIYIRAYTPSSVGPLMRDLWLKTTTLFTLGNFRPAKENSQGILETTGEVSIAEGTRTLMEIADGDAEISVIFDGVLPAARLPLGLPTPLPPDVTASVNDCARAFEK